MDEDDDDPDPNLPNTSTWIFDVNQKPVPQANQLAFGRVKVFLYESLYRSISRHNLHESFQLLKLLPKETSLDPYALFRFIFILLECNKTELVNKNVIIYLESLLNKLNLCKPDVFVEFLAYFIRHNRIDDAAELYDQRHRYMDSKFHRRLPFVDINLNCYGFLLKYLKWAERVTNGDSKHIQLDKSIQGWIVNAIDCLKTTTSNHEYFVMCVVRVLLFYAYFKKAYLFVYEFQSNNQDNIGAQLLFLNLINRLELTSMPMKEEQLSQIESVPMLCDITEASQVQNRQDDLAMINNFSSDVKEEIFEPNRYPIEIDKRNIMKNLRRLESSSAELMELQDMNDNKIDILKDLMDGMEMLHEVKNITRWHNLKNVLKEIFESNDEILITDARFLWHTRYKRFWNPIDFVRLAGDQISAKDKKLIGQVSDIMSSKLDRPIRLD